MTNVLEYLEKTVNEMPDKICYLDDKSEMSFRRVWNEARGIGTYLAHLGIYKKPVAVFMKKGPREVTAFLGAVYAGCYYIPMDVEMPLFRIELIFKLLGDCFIICDEASFPVLEKLDRGASCILYEMAAGTESDDRLLAGIRERQIDTDAVYVLFTSGSTGIPKGVIACHRSLIDYIDRLGEILKADKDTVFGNQTPLYTDACLKDLYPTLKYGATTVFIPKPLFSFPVRLISFMNEKKVNTICWVASALSIVSSLGTFESVIPKYLHTIASGSEIFPVRQYLIWKNTLPDARFNNLYGPTECTGCSCYYEIERDFEPDEVIPIGKHFQNTDVFLLSENNKPTPRGELGEICIRGTGVALGYYKNPEKTAEAFVQNPLNDCYPELIYRTGDLGRFNDRDELVYVSRKDFQIKHMGYRIELGEIEAVCGAFDGISLCCALYNKENKKILLYYTGSVDKNEVLKYLKSKLPRYMLPSELIHLSEMPFTLNGKIDRKGLAEESRTTV